MKTLLKKYLILAASLAGAFMCSPNSNAGAPDSVSGYARFDASNGIIAGRPLPARGRNVEIEIDPLLVINGPVIDAGRYTQLEWYVGVARNLLHWPEFSRVVNIQFSSELPHPRLIERAYVNRDVAEGYIAFISMVNHGRGLVVTLDLIGSTGVELLCEV